MPSFTNNFHVGEILLKIIFLFFTTYLTITVSKAQEEGILYNQYNQAIALIDKNNLIYWINEKKPIAHLVMDNNSNDVYSVYTIEGLSIGYFKEGILFDHSERIAAYLKGSLDKRFSQQNPNKAIGNLLMDLDINGWIDFKTMIGK